MESEYLKSLIDGLTPSAGSLVIFVKSFLWGGLAAFIFISASDFNEDGKKRLFRQVTTNVSDKLIYSFIGGLLSVTVQAISGASEVLLTQTITVGATWPYFIRKFNTKSAVNNFLESGDDFPVEEK